MIRAVFTPNPSRFIASLYSAAKGMAKSADAAIKAHVTDVHKYIVGNIRGGGFKLAPLKPKYEAEKLASGYGSTILVRTKKYVENIKVIRDEKGWRIGFEDGATDADGQPYETVALSLEMGTTRMAGRPHWRPTVDYARKALPGVARAVFSNMKITV